MTVSCFFGRKERMRLGAAWILAEAGLLSGLPSVERLAKAQLLCVLRTPG
jgi:hypothetical protein